MEPSSQPLTPDDFARLQQEVHGEWIRLAYDDRVCRQLAAYLISAGRPEDLFALVADSGAWAEARRAREGSYAGYLLDLDLAWQWCASESSWSVGRQIRCALIRASLSTPEVKIPAGLLAQAVEAGLWSPEQALAYVRQMPNEFRRAEALVRLVPLLPHGLKSDALEDARRIDNEYARANVLGELMPHLPQVLKLEAFEAARSIDDDAIRAVTLGGLAWLLPDDVKAEALAESWQAGLTDAGESPGASNAQLSQLSETIAGEDVAETLQAAPSIEDAATWGESLSSLSPELPDLLQDAADKAEALKTAALAEALQAAYDITDERARADALIGLIPLLTEALKVEALHSARTLIDPHARAHALSGMASYLPDPMKAVALSDAWQTTSAIDDGYGKAEALSELAAQLPAELMSQAMLLALHAAVTIADPDTRAHAMSKVAPVLPEDLKTQGLAEAVTAARAMTTSHARAETLSRLAPHLLPELKTEVVEEALRFAVAIGDEMAQLQALNALAAYVLDDRRAEASGVSRLSDDEGLWTGDENALAPFSTSSLKPESAVGVLQAVRAHPDEDRRAYTLSHLISYLPEAVGASVAPEALALAIHIASPAQAEHRRASVLRRVIAAWQAMGFAGPSQARNVWREALRALAEHRRPELLYDIIAFLPLIHHLGGDEAIRETHLAIRDVTQWWP